MRATYTNTDQTWQGGVYDGDGEVAIWLAPRTADGELGQKRIVHSAIYPTPQGTSAGERRRHVRAFVTAFLDVVLGPNALPNAAALLYR